MSQGIFDLLKKLGGSETEEQDLSNKTLKIIQSRCPQNHACPSVRVCPVAALSQQGNKAPIVDKEKCTKCGKCVKYCPMKAITLS